MTKVKKDKVRREQDNDDMQLIDQEEEVGEELSEQEGQEEEKRRLETGFQLERKSAFGRMRGAARAVRRSPVCAGKGAGEREGEQEESGEKRMIGAEGSGAGAMEGEAGEGEREGEAGEGESDGEAGDGVGEQEEGGECV